MPRTKRPLVKQASRWLITHVLLLLISFAAASPLAHAEATQKKIHRLALVIGNQTYGGQPWLPLVSPIKDAEDVWKIFGDAGFERNRDYLVLDGNGRTLRAAIEDFGLRVRQVRKDILKRNAEDSEAMVVVVFLSGHGFMSNDTAYFAGTDVKGEFIEDLTDQSIAVNQLVRDLTPNDRDVDFLSVILVDACRSNVQLPSRVSKANKGMPFSKGNPFGLIQGIGRIAVFATTEGKPSYDGRNNKENSIFTAAIIESAQNPGQPVSFSEFVTRIERNTIRLAKVRFNVEQSPEVYRTGVDNDFFWSADKGAEASKTAGLSNSKGGAKKAAGWIWIGDYGTPAGQDSQAWLAPRATPSSGGLLAAPAAIPVGSELTIQANLNVRDEFPVKDAACGKDKKYQECAKLLGTIPRGLKVITLQPPKATGVQNWVRVEFDADALYK